MLLKVLIIHSECAPVQPGSVQFVPLASMAGDGRILDLEGALLDGTYVVSVAGAPDWFTGVRQLQNGAVGADPEMEPPPFSFPLELLVQSSTVRRARKRKKLARKPKLQTYAIAAMLAVEADGRVDVRAIPGRALHVDCGTLVCELGFNADV